MSCQFPGCSRHGQSNGYCIGHAQYAGYAGEVREKKAPNKKSEKQAKLDKEYKKIVKEMLAADPMCEMNTPVCTRKAEGLHHMKRRGVNTLNRKYLKRSCNACNGYVEEHPLWAIENKLSLKVHSKQ
jgi:hypothetical protein